MNEPKVALVHSESPRGREAYEELASQWPFVPVEEADVIVALGGDGFMLETLHAHMDAPKPVYGMNRGTIGFLLNDYRMDSLVERMDSAERVTIHPLLMQATDVNGVTHTYRAINEVSVLRYSHQSANLEISIDGDVFLEKLACDGILVSTPAGSTAYNLSAGGPVIPLGSNILALTPVSPFRPRRWRGALLPNTVEIRIQNLDPDKRPIGASGDSMEVEDVASVTITQDPDTALTLLFDQRESLHERVLREQFLSG